MNLVKLCYFIFAATLLTGCDFHCSIGETKPAKSKTVTSGEKTSLSGAVIKNDIDLEASGVKVREVYLLDANKNLLEENITRINEKIYVVIKTDTGWVKENGRSFVGASERISTASGKVIVDAEDIFTDYGSTGIPAEDAALISLSALITEADPGLDRFTVQFRVWDKKGKGEIRGKYKFRIKR